MILLWLHLMYDFLVLEEGYGTWWSMIVVVVWTLVGVCYVLLIHVFYCEVMAVVVEMSTVFVVLILSKMMTYCHKHKRILLVLNILRSTLLLCLLLRAHKYVWESNWDALLWLCFWLVVGRLFTRIKLLTRYIWDFGTACHINLTVAM